MFTRDIAEESYGMVDITSGKTPAYIFVIMIITLVVVMFPYIIFYDYVTNVFYGIAIANGGDPGVFNLIASAYGYYFIIAFAIGLFLWAIVNTMRPDEP